MRNREELVEQKHCHRSFGKGFNVGKCIRRLGSLPLRDLRGIRLGARSSKNLIVWRLSILQQLRIILRQPVIGCPGLSITATSSRTRCVAS